MTPEQALDLQVDTAEWWRAQTGQMYGSSFSTSFTKEKGFPYGIPLLAERERKRLLEAETYLVTHSMSLAVEAMAQALPDDSLYINLDMPMHPCGFAILERPVYITDVRGETLGAKALLWSVENVMHVFGDGTEKIEMPCVYLSVYGDTDDEGDTNMAALRREHSPERVLRLGKLSLWHLQPILPTMPLNKDDVLQRFIWTLWRVTNQRIALTRRYKPTRAAWKRAYRRGKFDSEITIVTLRREVQEGGRQERPEGEPAFWYTHRFIVRGHWHYVWCGSEKDDTRHLELRWYDSYIKGPEDGPLIVKDTVWKVSR